MGSERDTRYGHEPNGLLKYVRRAPRKRHSTRAVGRGGDFPSRERVDANFTARRFGLGSSEPTSATTNRQTKRSHAVFVKIG